MLNVTDQEYFYVKVTPLDSAQNNSFEIVYHKRNHRIHLTLGVPFTDTLVENEKIFFSIPISENPIVITNHVLGSF